MERPPKKNWVLLGMLLGLLDLMQALLLGMLPGLFGLLLGMLPGLLLGMLKKMCSLPCAMAKHLGRRTPSLGGPKTTKEIH